MKKSPLLVAVFAAALCAGGALWAADAAKEVTITGEGKCAKCELGETKECQNAIEVTENGKPVIYYLAKNATSDAFHKNVCTTPQKVTATGVASMMDGKHVLTVSKIEVAK